MKKTVPFLFLVLSTFVAMPAWSTRSVGEDILDREDVRDSIGKQITRLDLKASIDLLDMEVVEGLNLGTRYRYEVEPAYLSGIFTRIDRWRMNASFNPGTIINELGSPVYLGMGKGAEVLFVRHYKNQKKAIADLPSFDVRKIPFRAESALRHLKPGESVLMPLDLNLFAGVRGSSHSSGIEGTIGTEFFLQGRFLLQVLRLDDSKVRLRLVSRRQSGNTTYGRIETNFEVFGVSIADKLLRRLAVDDVFELRKDKSKGVMFMADYLFDLSDSSAAEAYNNIMATGFKFKDVRVINPFLSAEEVSKLFVNDLSQAETLALEDARLPMDQRRVSRIFQGFNTFHLDGNRFRMGSNLAEIRMQNAFTRNMVSFLGVGDETSNLFYPTYSKSRETKFLWGIFREKSRRNTSVLYDLDAFEEKFSNYVVSFEVTDKRLSLREKSRVFNALRRTIRPDILKNFDLSFFESQQEMSGARVYAQLVFHKEAFNHMRGQSLKRLAFLFSAYAKANGLEDHIKEVSTVQRRVGLIGKDHSYVSVEKDFVTPMLEVLKEVFDQDFGSDQSKGILKRLVELRKNPVFDAVGTGFFMYLLRTDKLEESVFVRLNCDANEIKSQRQVFGQEERLEVLLAMEYIQNMIQNGAFDLRLETFGTPIRTVD